MPQAILSRLPLCVGLTLCSLVAARPTETAWKHVQLPARPIDVETVGDTLWVCGANGMVAESPDGGKTWQVKHIAASGSVLVSIKSSDEKTFAAAGSNGQVLLTTDAGGSWKTITTGTEPIFDAAFSDELHGIVETDSALKFTSDGGATWKEISVLRADPDLEEFKYFLGVAALDSNHMVALAKAGGAQYYDQRFVVTIDGGKNWKVVEAPSTVIIAVVARAGEFWAMGHEVIEKDKPGGGYGVALTMHSADGITWLHSPRAQSEFGNCGSGGCLFSQGVGDNPFGSAPSYWVFSPDVAVTAKWAAAKGGICTISNEMKCTSITPLPTLPKGSLGGPVPPALAPDNSHRRVADLTCISCPFKEMIVNPEKSGRAQIGIELTVGSDGLVADAKILDTPTKEIGVTAVDEVRQWMFRPVGDVAHPEVHLRLHLNVMLIKSPS
jgi:hypothetical protein